VAVGVGTVTQAGLPGGTGSSTTFSFTSTNQPLYVIAPFWVSGAVTLNSVTFGGVALTRIAQSAFSSGNERVEIWRLVNPSASTANIVATFSATSASGTLAVFNTTGQDTATPEGTAATAVSAANGTATGSLAISGAASGDLVIAGIAVGNGAAVTPANTGGTGLTELMDAVNNGEGSEAFRVSDAVTAVSGSWTGSTSWAIAAIPLKASVGAADPFPAGYRLGRYQPPNRQTLFAR
jgi:hypothetical protein